MAITQEMLDRINELSRKKKAEGLTEEETAEQKVLYKEYIATWRASVKSQLECIEFVDDNGKSGKN